MFKANAFELLEASAGSQHCHHPPSQSEMSQQQRQNDANQTTAQPPNCTSDNVQLVEVKVEQQTVEDWSQTGSGAVERLNAEVKEEAMEEDNEVSQRRQFWNEQSDDAKVAKEITHQTGIKFCLIPILPVADVQQDGIFQFHLSLQKLPKPILSYFCRELK